MKKDRDDDIEREIRTHLDLEAEERVANGMSETDARYAARRAFGNVTHTQEDMRAVWTRRWLDELVQTGVTPSARPARAPVTHPRIITRSRCPGDLSDAQVRADASSYTYSTCERTAPSSPAILGFVESIT